MKKIYELTAILCLISINAGCQKTEFLGDDFEQYASAYSFDSLAKQTRDKEPLLTDLRDLKIDEDMSFQAIFFSYDDVTLGGPLGPSDKVYSEEEKKNVQYPSTIERGWTSIYFKNRRLFSDEWSFPYMGTYRLITNIHHGNCGNYQLLYVAGAHKERLLVSTGDRLEDFDLYTELECVHVGRVNKDSTNLEPKNYKPTIWATDRENTIIIYGTDWVRMHPKYRYFIIFDLKTRQYKRIAVDYYYKC